MSINYHAHQNRGFLLSTYEEIESKWRNAFRGYDPERVKRILSLEGDEEYLYFDYYRNRYRLRLQDGVLQKKLKEKREKVSYTDLETGETVTLDPDWTDDVYFNEAMAVYHLLYYVKDVPLISGTWLTNEDIISSAGSRRNMPDPLLVPFAALFSGKLSLLKECCEKAGGKKIDGRGDLDYEFLSFPQIPVRLSFWDADEDFSAQAKVLFDRCITDYVHIETTGCITADLFELIESFM